MIIINIEDCILLEKKGAHLIFKKFEGLWKTCKDFSDNYS